MRSESRYRARSRPGGSTKGMNSRAYAAREMPGTASGRCPTFSPSVVTQCSRTPGRAAAAAIISRLPAVIPMSHRYRSSPRPGLSWETTERTVAASGRLKRSSAARTAAIRLSATRATPVGHVSGSRRPPTAPRSVRPAPAEDRGPGLPENLQVEGEGPVFHITQVQPDGLVPGQVRPAVDLPETGDARLDRQPAPHVALYLTGPAGDHVPGLSRGRHTASTKL